MVFDDGFIHWLNGESPHIGALQLILFYKNNISIKTTVMTAEKIMFLKMAQ